MEFTHDPLTRDCQFYILDSLEYECDDKDQ